MNGWTLTVSLAILLQACTGVNLGPTAELPISGRITEISSNVQYTELHLDQLSEAAEAISGTDRLILVVYPTTTLHCNHCDFQVGMNVTAWHSGVMLRSSPPQFIATRIELRSES